LRNLTPQIEIGSVIPIAHGAAAAIILDGKLVSPPADYEEPIDARLRWSYDKMRDAFSLTGSPALPNGLNLGAQLFRSRDLLSAGTQILLWPQYWAWRLSGVAASEVTSLGCHTDLWRPKENCFSRLAESLDWAAHFPLLRFAGDALGTVDEEWAAMTGLPRDASVHCGLHDSNAALIAARTFPEIGGSEATVLSTGTWFVAMCSLAEHTDLPELAEERDCLFNVDAYGTPVPSARFMGGREIEILGSVDPLQNESMLAALPEVLAKRAMVLPGFAPGVGPFPRHQGSWLNQPVEQSARSAAICLYAAMVADTSLNLIGANDRILVEGRFVRLEVFVRALAALRPRDAIYTTDTAIDGSFGALCLLNNSLRPKARLRQVKALDIDLNDYHATWLTETNGSERR